MSENKYDYLVKQWSKFELSLDLEKKKEIDGCFSNYVNIIQKGKLTLEGYTNRITKKNPSNCDYFCTFIENKSSYFYGSASAGSAQYFGIKKNDDQDTYYISKRVDGKSEQLNANKELAKKEFFKILEDLKKLVKEKLDDDNKNDIFKAVEEENIITSKVMLRKIVAMNNKGKFLYIYSDEMIDTLYKFFIPDGNETTNIEKNYELVEKLKEIFKPNNNQQDEEYVLYLSHFLWTKFKFTIDINTKNIILHGAPGTGKTYLAEENVRVHKMIEDATYELVQFHPSYSYEDFIDGIKPIKISSGQMQFELKNGVFKQMCIDAFKELVKAIKDNRKPKKFYFIADEINRAELSRVFGELLLCIEDDKRIKIIKDVDKLKVEGTKVKTANSMLWEKKHAVVTVKKDTDEILTDEGKDLKDNQKYEFYFGVPENIYFIGTMNDVDRSVDSFDMALRRRFFWKRMNCDYEAILDELGNYNNIGEIESNKPVSGFLKACYDFNRYIITNDKIEITTKRKDTENKKIEGLCLGITYEIGHAYFFKIKNFIGKKTTEIKNNHLKDLFNFSIEPLLREYLRANYDEKDIDKKLKIAKNIFSLE